MRGTLAAPAVLAVLLVAAPARAGEDRVDPLAIPLVALGAGPTVPVEAIEAVAAGLAAPTLRGEALRRRLSLADPGDATGDAALIVRGEGAKDLFFAGDHEAARADFEALLAGIEGRPERLARLPDLRSVAFGARLFLAVIARLQGREQVVDELLVGARRRYPELEPGTADFPPWLRERHGGITLSRPDGAGGVAVEVPAGCELSVDGRAVAPGAAGEVLGDGGAHALQARCDGRPGPVVLVPEGTAPARARPVALRSTALAGEGGEVALAADVGADDEALVRDLLELARAAGAPRLAAVVGRPGGIELWLVDVDAGARVRLARVAGTGTEPAALERAGAELAGIGPAGEDAKRPWYRDGTAWAVTAAGVAAAATGLILGQAYGGPSAQEPAAVALMASGAVLAATGVVLFLVPAPGESGGGVALSAGAAVSF